MIQCKEVLRYKDTPLAVQIACSLDNNVLMLNPLEYMVRNCFSQIHQQKTVSLVS